MKTLRERILEYEEKDFGYLTFGDLEQGDSYIILPMPGDEKNDKGYKTLYSIRTKVGNKGGLPHNSVGGPKGRYQMNDDIKVILIKKWGQ